MHALIADRFHDLLATKEMEKKKTTDDGRTLVRVPGEPFGVRPIPRRHDIVKRARNAASRRLACLLVAQTPFFVQPRYATVN